MQEGVAAFVPVDICLNEVGEFFAKDALLHVSVKLIDYYHDALD